jgi:hypothetical protein
VSQAEVSPAASDVVARMPSFGEAVRVWTKIGLLSFDGPAGQIALLHREVVDNRNWISDKRFLHGLSFCNLLPGPEAQSLKIFCRSSGKVLQAAVLLSRIGLWLGCVTKVERWHRMAWLNCLKVCPTKQRRSLRAADCLVCGLPNAIRSRGARSVLMGCWRTITGFVWCGISFLGSI